MSLGAYSSALFGDSALSGLSFFRLCVTCCSRLSNACSICSRERCCFGAALTALAALAAFCGIWFVGFWFGLGAGALQVL